MERSERPGARCEATGGFWDRFTFDTDLLLVADSNAYAGPLAWEGGFAEVVLFDAHHDSGYRRAYADSARPRRICGAVT